MVMIIGDSMLYNIFKFFISMVTDGEMRQGFFLIIFIKY